MSNLPWSERLNAISINPDMATRDDIARMACKLIDHMSAAPDPAREALRGLVEACKAIDGYIIECPEVSSCDCCPWMEFGCCPWKIFDNAIAAAEAALKEVEHGSD